MSIASKPSYDQRLDLGYGTNKKKFHASRKGPTSFPYIEEPDYEDLDKLPDDDPGINSKIPTADYRPGDFFAAAGTDHFYFVAGNTKLSDCFERPDQVLREIESTGKSMSPIPRAYRGGRKNHTRGGHSAKYIKNTSFRRTGDMYGWSRPTIDPNDENDDPIYTLSDLLDLDSEE